MSDEKMNHCRKCHHDGGIVDQDTLLVDQAPTTDTWFYVNCIMCNFTSEHSRDEKGAIKAWNGRTPDTTLQTEVKNLRVALSTLRAAPYVSSQQPRHGLNVHFSPDMIRQADDLLSNDTNKPQDEIEPCEICGGDGKATCTNPDHGFVTAMGGEPGRLGCPVCGHDPDHKVPGGGDCDECDGTGLTITSVTGEDTDG